MPLLTKRYPVFDCDSHVTEATAIWDYLTKREQDEVRPWFWPKDQWLILNGKRLTYDAFSHGRIGLTFGFYAAPPDGRTPAAGELAGPGVTKQIIRKLRSAPLTHEQIEYVEQKGARDGLSRIKDMDQQGIDQVMVIPLMMFSSFLFIENHRAAALMARAYNDWAWDWCAVAPERLFPCGALPIQNPVLAAEELRRIAKRGFRVAAVRAVDVQGGYPNQAAHETVWNTFEETGLVVGMHSLSTRELPNPTGQQWSPGQFQDRTISRKQMGGASQALGFYHEAMTWLTGVLLSGFLDRHPKVAMAMMESNASWLPMLLDEADRAARLYGADRRSSRAARGAGGMSLPSEAFRRQCFIAFEGDEAEVYRQHEYFQRLGIWSSDVYHHDGADAWTAIGKMQERGVPEETQALLMGDNARRMYGIAPKMFTHAAPAGYPRPGWYPTQEAVEREYAHRMKVS